MSSDADSLQYLPMGRWGELEEAFKTDWPRGISGYTALRTQRDLASRGLDYGFKVYCPYGDVSSGMVALNKKGTLNEVIIQCPSDDTTQLEKAILCSKTIDWKGKILVPYMPNHILESVRRIAENFNFEIEAEDTEPNELFLLPKHTAMYSSPSNPELTIKPVSEEHLTIVDSTWRNRYEGSLWLFGILIKAGLGYGLFKNDELVSWVLLNEVGALTHLFTLEEHRNNKYAETLLQYLCNLCLKDGKDVFAYCRKGNKSACKVYEKLGFEKFHEDTLNEIIIHSPRLDTTQLEKALVSTKVIDWSKPILVPCLPPHTYECVRKVAQKLNLNFEGENEHIPHDLVLFDLHKPSFDVRLPDDMTFQLLTEDLVDDIDAVWPNRYDSSKWVFKLLIKNKTGYGLFKNKELVAWVFINEIGALVHLYTHDEHRNKGYGKILMKMLCNKYLEEKKPVFGYCMRGNVSAEKLYESLGFEKFYHVIWIMFIPK